MQDPSRLAIKPPPSTTPTGSKPPQYPGLGWPFRPFFHGRRPLVERFRTPGGSDVLLPYGYAQSRTVPFPWIWLGVILTLLESWNADWTWVAPNILFSFALIRMARPYVQDRVQHHGWAAFALLVSALIAVQPIAEKMVDYGAEGWLWALFGLYNACMSTGDRRRTRTAQPKSGTARAGYETERRHHAAARLLLAAVFYVWQEQKEFAFSTDPIHRRHSRHRRFVR